MTSLVSRARVCPKQTLPTRHAHTQRHGKHPHRVFFPCLPTRRCPRGQHGSHRGILTGRPRRGMGRKNGQTRRRVRDQRGAAGSRTRPSVPCDRVVGWSGRRRHPGAVRGARREREEGGRRGWWVEARKNMFFHTFLASENSKAVESGLAKRLAKLDLSD